ncbi:hypothetical protein [Sedimenticola sp.]|uniref:hypothetical protein n=1 Tax=Sedimenticola sp. TaxID=1940285 RepID=UPI00258824FA|nr:hypothetical protein [Sedimenticola sp.]MCW8904273.1 hypothetical protein [Sedimenticola sp.]
MQPLWRLSVTGAIDIFQRVCSRLNNPAYFFNLAGIFGALLLAPFALTASDYFSLSLGNLGDEEWQAQGVVLQLDLQSPQDRFVLSADEIRHPGLPAPVRTLRFACQSGKIEDDRISCQEGLIDFSLNGQEQHRIISRIDWEISSQLIDIYLDNITLSGGKFTAEMKLDEQQWRLLLRGRDVEIKKLEKLHAALAGPIGWLSLNGRFGLSMDLRGRGAQLHRGSTRINFTDVSFSDQSGNYIGQGLTGEWRGGFSLSKGNWSGKQQMDISAGEVLTPLFYLSPSSHPLSLETAYRYQTNKSLITLDTFKFSQPERLDITGSADISVENEAQLVALSLTSKAADLAPLFRDNVLPVLANPQLEDMELAGQIAVDITHLANNTQLGVVLKDVYIEQGLQMRKDGKGQFALYDLDGEINWSSGLAKESHLSWQGGHLFGDITLGATAVDLNLSGGAVSLVKQASIPVLDGKLQAEKFSLEQGESGPKVQFQGFLTPISMAAISSAVGWPPLAGQLSGMIPGLSYENGVIAVNGVALVKIFDGEIVIRDLKLDDLFGPLPALSADLELNDIELETLTRAFSFGKITGKLEGRVDDLRLEDWAPVSFNAAFYTPEDDDSRHRINQKAVDNISNLGGSGVSGAISRSFLRMFEDFGYDRLGISCRLERGVCHMGGIEAADRGYYLVKGGGLPRIDIMGFNRKTDWQVLVSKLKQITEGGAPVIK